jgi:hypothetical protein
MYNNPTYGGAPIFGLAVKFRPAPNPPALQLDAYQGINGQVCLFGGTRGGVVHVSGVLADFDIPSVNNDLATITSYDDGIARTLIDPEGNSYGDCVYAGMGPPQPALPTATGWCKSYDVRFMVLSG